MGVGNVPVGASVNSSVVKMGGSHPLFVGEQAHELMLHASEMLITDERRALAVSRERSHSRRMNKGSL